MNGRARIAAASAFIALVLLSEPGFAEAAVTLGLVTSGGSATALNVNPGQTRVRVDLNFNDTNFEVTMLVFDIAFDATNVADITVEGGTRLRTNRRISYQIYSVSGSTVTYRVVVYGLDTNTSGVFSPQSLLQSSLTSSQLGYGSTGTALQGNSLLRLYFDIESTATAAATIAPRIDNTTIQLIKGDGTAVSGSPTLTAQQVTLTVASLELGGDNDGDGTIEAADVQNIVSVALGLANTVANSASADLNRDGLVNVADVQTAINALLGQPVLLQILPAEASVGDIVVFHGPNLSVSGTAGTVAFRGAAGEVLATTVTVLTVSGKAVGLNVTVPAGAISGMVEVRTTKGTGAITADFESNQLDFKVE